MNGQELYEMYVQANIDVMNCGVEEWDALMTDDRVIWETMASRLNDLYSS
jgi:hypothetical protein